MAYNILAGGTCLEDIELLRNDNAWLDALDAEIIPDPTTAGDFLRRFEEQDILDLMDAKNTIRSQLWEKQPESFKKEAIINIDGTITETFGECKKGMDISYNGKWGYAPLIISLEKTREALFIVNRSGNAPSHLGSAPWIDKTIELLGKSFEKIYLRGDTDFSLTSNFDKWDKDCSFVFGMDARKNLVNLAEQISESEWELFQKTSREIETKERKLPENIKEKIVIERNYKNITTEYEHITEFDYQPGQCNKSYRIIVLRKFLKVMKGETFLFNENRYFFYITNDEEKSTRQVVEFYRKRADHENDIDQLKHGVKAMKNPSNSLLSNWAYMVIASLAWDLKAWYGLLMPYKALGKEIIRMEFKKFVNTLIKIPCLIIKTGRKIEYRIIAYNDQIKHMFKLFSLLKQRGFT